MLELLFYIGLFAIIAILVINALFSMTRGYRETTIYSELLQSGNIMERITREIRQATGINTISSNDLKLDTKDEAGASKTVEFALSGTNIQLLENNAFVGNLNSPDIAVTALTFTQITTTTGKAVKVSLTVRSNHDAQGRSFDFNDTVVLRGNY